MLGDFFYQLGRSVGGLESQVRGKAGAAGSPGAAVYDVDTGEVHDLDHDPFGDEEGDGSAADAVGTALAGAAAAWIAARVLRPRPVSWPRVLFAGVAATSLADAVGRTLEEGGPGGGLPFADDPEELLARLAAGVAVAAGYASLLYPRIPGPPLFRGLVFAALEVAAAPRGGLVQLAHDTRGIRFPLQALAAPVDEDAGTLSHLAFGLGLGLFYRNGHRRHRHEDDED